MSTPVENPYASQPFGYAAREELGDLVENHPILDRKERARLKGIVAEAVADILANYEEFMATVANDELGWKYQAACRMAVNIFDEPSRGESSVAGRKLQTKFAKSICDACEVRVECFADAAAEDNSLETGGQHGVYGIRAGQRFARPARTKSRKKVS